MGTPPRRSIVDRLALLRISESGSRRRRHPIGQTLLLIWGGILLLGLSAVAIGWILTLVVWAVPLGIYLVGRFPGPRAAWVHDRLLVLLGTVIGVTICVLVIWGLLLGSGPCWGWGCS
jgi:hypothetical protein